MITWMTRASLGGSVSDLSTTDLVQTSVEARKMLNDHIFEERGTSEPMMRAWVGHERWLAAYIALSLLEMAQRGISVGAEILDTRRDMVDALLLDGQVGDKPSWFEDVDVLRSHRSNLLRLNNDVYDGKWGSVPELWPYLFPVSKGGQHSLMVSRADRNRLENGERTLPKSVAERVINL